MDIYSFLYEWQELLGALIATLVAIGFSFYLHHQRERADKRRQYSHLLLILQDIRRFISKCEHYLESAKKKEIPFDKIIINEKIDYMAPTQVFNLKPEFYTAIEQVYNVASVISYNFKLSEVLEINVKKKKGGEVHSQKNVVSNKHGDTLNLIRYYLTDIYHKFNIIAKDVKILRRKHKYLQFSGDITFYNKKDVLNKIERFGLENHHL